MSKLEFGILCLRSISSMMILVQAPSGYCIHILESEEQMKRFGDYFGRRQENKFIPLPPEEVEECQRYLEGLKKEADLIN